MRNQSQWNAWQHSGNKTAMTYSTGEGFTPEQKKAIHQTFRKLQKLTDTAFQETKKRDLFTRKEVLENPALRAEYRHYLHFDAQTFHRHFTPEGHSDLHITTEMADNRFLRKILESSGYEYEANETTFGSATTASSDGHPSVTGQDTGLVRINASLFSGGNHSGIAGFTDTLYHELAHAVAGFTHTSYSKNPADDKGVADFVHEMQKIRLTNDQGDADVGVADNNQAEEMQPSFYGDRRNKDSSIRPKRSLESRIREIEQAEEVDESSRNPDREIETLYPHGMPVGKNVTYKIHGHASQDPDTTILKSLLGKDFRNINSAEPVDINIVYFNKHQCPKTPAVQFGYCGKDKYLWINREITNATLAAELEKQLPTLRQHLNPLQDAAIDRDIEHVTPGKRQQRDLLPAPARHIFRQYDSWQLPSYSPHRQNSPVVHSTQQDMNGDGLADVLQFDSNGVYQVSLRRAGGIFGPMMSQRQWEASLQHQVTWPAGNASPGSFAGAEGRQYSSWSPPPAAPLRHQRQGRWMKGDNTGVAVLGDYVATPVPAAAFTPVTGWNGNKAYAASHWQYYNGPYHARHYYS